MYKAAESQILRARSEELRDKLGVTFAKWGEENVLNDTGRVEIGEDEA